MRLSALGLPALLLSLTACADKADPDSPSDGSDGGSGFIDADGDGWSSDEDCDDGNPLVSPGAVEGCNGVDDDCDGTVDEGATTTYYQDVDGDGYGDASATTEACTLPAGQAEVGTDCDDQDADIHPGAPETDCADPTDYNCDGSAGGQDQDADGYAACEDCDDGRPEVNPGGTELCDGLLDEDCDGVVDEDDAADAGTWYGDADGDGYGDAFDASTHCDAPPGGVADGTDCDDLEAGVHPGADELCDGLLDEDCDGTIDEDDAVDAPTWFLDDDGDGFGDPLVSTRSCLAAPGEVADATDCDDLDPLISPDAWELCDGVTDEDCDGVVDEDDAIDASTWYADVDGDAFGDPASSYSSCSLPPGFVADDTDCDDAFATTNPAGTELCDGVTDEDCDGSIDEADAADALTWYLDADSDGYGDPASAAPGCAAPTGHVADDTDCDDGRGAVHPGGTELCDGSLDENCDGIVDEDSAADALTWFRDADGDGYGAAASTKASCTQPSGYLANSTDCDDGAASVSPAATEVCDGIDRDCDGNIDFGYSVPLTHSLSAAWSAAADGDHICVAAGTYAVNLSRSTGVTLESMSGADLTILDGGAAGRVVQVSGGSGSIKGFTLQNGLANNGAGLHLSGGGEWVLEDLVVQDNHSVATSTSLGTGIYLLNVGATLSLVDLLGNTASGKSVSGTALYANTATLDLDRVQILGNTGSVSTSGNGVLASVATDLTATNLLIAGNTVAENDGNAAIYAAGFSSISSGSVDMENVTITGNTGRSGSGKVHSVGYLSYPASGKSIDHHLVNVTNTGNVATGTTIRTAGYQALRSSTWSFSYCNAYGNTTANFYNVTDPTGSNGNIGVSPGFVDTSSVDPLDWDLGLASGSGLIDVGDPSLLDSDGSRSDIGAFGGPYGSWP